MAIAFVNNYDYLCFAPKNDQTGSVPSSVSGGKDINTIKLKR